MSDEKDQTPTEAPQEVLTIESVNKLVNAAISSRNKALEKRLDEMMSKLSPQQPEQPAKEEKVSNAELAQLKRQFEQMKAEKEAEFNKRRETEMRTSVKEQLSSIGVPQQYIKAAMAMLIDSDRAISFNDDNELMLKVGEYEYPLVEGLKVWSKSEDGKAFLPPKGAKGSGAKPVGAPAEKVTAANVGELLMNAYKNGQL